VLKTTGANFETVRTGNVTDTDYYVEADLYLNYRSGGTEWERSGIFARDTGHGAFNSTLYEGSCYAFDWRSNNGQFRVGKMTNGQFTSLASVPNLQGSGWAKFRISCVGSTITYSLNDSVVGSVTDTSYPQGMAGIVHMENYANPDVQQGTWA